MNILLIFFALPIAVIIISIALQRILKNPILVAAIIFAIFLIVTFIVNNLNFLIAAIAYAILSFITAFLTCIVCRILNRWERENSCCCRRNLEDLCCCRREQEDNCCCRRRENGYCCGNNNNKGNSNNLLTINSVQDDTSNCTENQNDNGCSYQITNSDGLSARINIIPNSNNNNTNNTNGNCCCRRRRF